MIRLNAFAQLTDNSRRDELIAAATELVQLSRAEDGCIAYDFFASQTIPANFMFCETWANQQALNSHSASAHFVRLVAEIEAICGPLKLERFDF